jgi:hypothetical protein
MNELDQLLKDSTSKIEDAYFLLPTLGGEKYRERVYAYELYHQLRSIWTSTQFFLNGEVDKKGHPCFPESGPQPDLIVHERNTTNNLAVFQIKACNAQNAGIDADLLKLQYFRKEVGYLRAIYLVYGTQAEECAQKIINRNGYDTEIEIWLHLAPGEQAEPRRL